jgi:hypothetical protein
MASLERYQEGAWLMHFCRLYAECRTSRSTPPRRHLKQPTRGMTLSSMGALLQWCSASKKNVIADRIRRGLYRSQMPTLSWAFTYDHTSR